MIATCPHCASVSQVYSAGIALCHLAKSALAAVKELLDQGFSAHLGSLSFGLFFDIIRAAGLVMLALAELIAKTSPFKDVVACTPFALVLCDIQRLYSRWTSFRQNLDCTCSFQCFLELPSFGADIALCWHGVVAASPWLLAVSAVFKFINFGLDTYLSWEWPRYVYARIKNESDQVIVVEMYDFNGFWTCRWPSQYVVIAPRHSAYVYGRAKNIQDGQQVFVSVKYGAQGVQKWLNAEAEFIHRCGM